MRRRDNTSPVHLQLSAPDGTWHATVDLAPGHIKNKVVVGSHDLPTDAEIIATVRANIDHWRRAWGGD